ncbi:unnamed protein product [Rotaria sp. Silwood1]|nr:unnamed protein product [Rotaria sp. Silwood1]CAF1674549.1 unnamed protein product [Rotaria sp. Silwood1]
MDMKTNLDIWYSYERILKRYILEGNQLHWLAVSLDVLFRRYRGITRNDNNSILVPHKWESMVNSPE